VLAHLSRSFSGSSDPFFIYFGGHGEQGDDPSENSVSLWGGKRWVVTDLANMLDSSALQRRVRVVVAACYSGGFGHLAFLNGTPDLGAARGDRCGLFASTWDRESTGCDPDPDRRMQEGYSLHFFHALRGNDRDGKPLPKSEIDVNGDGGVSLLEAHTHVRIASRSIDVPTTTSETWLRHVGPSLVEQPGALEIFSFPEEEAVIHHLGKELGVHSALETRQRLEHLVAMLDAMDAQLEDVEKKLDETYSHLRMALLERWPVIDDPWHPEFANTLSNHGTEIESFLARSPLVTSYRLLQEELERQMIAQGPKRVESAMLMRLARALETKDLASRLSRTGGSKWKHYQKLLECERSRL
jgi:hypothetical protein